jgi:mono/diheme cytochrome c family protein/peroxiredoxin
MRYEAEPSAPARSRVRVAHIIWQKLDHPSKSNKSANQRPRYPLKRALLGLIVFGIVLGVVLRLKADRDRVVAADQLLRAKIVSDFQLSDTFGKLHSLASFKDHKAIVLFFLRSGCLESNAALADVVSLADVLRAQGAAVLAVEPSSDSSLMINSPILLDPSHELIETIGITVTPEAAVLSPDGLVLYRGNLDGVSSAVAAAVKGGRPRIRETEAQGSSMIPPAPALPPDYQVTYHADIAPILNRHCVECHRPGQVGPFSLATYRDAAKRASFIHQVTESGQMPPWRAMQGWGKFHDAHHVSKQELALLEQWAATGATEGTSVETHALAEPSEWQLGPPDLILTMAEPYEIKPNGDDWRGFVLPGSLTDGRAIAAVEYKPGNRKVAHHSRVFLDATDYAEKLDAEQAGNGFSYDGRFDIPRPALIEWGPGMKLRNPPEGVAKPVKPGSRVVLLMHYHGTGKPETDRSSVGIYFAKTPPNRIMAMHTLSSNRIDIPAGAATHREIARSTVQHDIKAYSVFPHGHNLLREMMLTATLPDGSIKRMLFIHDWNFGWQTQYYYAEPVSLPKGTKLEVLAIYDNSAGNPSNPHKPPQRVKYGPSSEEEMLGCHLYVVADDDAGNAYYQRKWEESK